MQVVAVIGCAHGLFRRHDRPGANRHQESARLLHRISQLGYMFLACGVGAFGAGIFHLMTHAFFKACSSSAPAA